MPSMISPNNYDGIFEMRTPLQSVEDNTDAIIGKADRRAEHLRQDGRQRLQRHLRVVVRVPHDL